MPPQETTSLVNADRLKSGTLSFDEDVDSSPADRVDCLSEGRRRPILHILAASFAVTLVVTTLCRHGSSVWNALTYQELTGPYKLVERQVGSDFFSFYDFYAGPDTLGSAGFNAYVSKERAWELGLVRIEGRSEDIIIQSAATDLGPRESIRLEGKRRFERGLFILDVSHIPAGCGVWPAFWLTDDDKDQWPAHGEIDIVEGVNTLSTAKTALHTSESCSMYAHVPTWAHTGVWDRASGIPDTWTGALDTNTSVPADNCWSMAAHQWANQGCVMTESRDDTIGEGFNRKGGGVYALEWDPTNGYIKSWVWAQGEIPANLQEAMATSANDHKRVDPDPSLWNTPYAYFAIGAGTGCSANHFQNHRIIFNLAFCGTVAGNRFLMDCPSLSSWTDLNDPIEACNAYIQSEPKSLDDAYWRIRGVYVYERTMQNRMRGNATA